MFLPDISLRIAEVMEDESNNGPTGVARVPARLAPFARVQTKQVNKWQK